MKTLEIKTTSGTYLVVELPDGSTNVYVTQSEDLGDDFYIAPFINFTVQGDKARALPIGSWQLIGFGKDHPKLVEEFGLLSENPINAFKPTCTCDACIIERNRMDEAESKVFKNPLILKKQ